MPSPDQQQQQDDDGFTKVTPRIRYKPAPAAAAGKARRNRKGRPAAPPVDEDGQVEGEASQVARIRDTIDGRRKLLQFGAWAESWEVLVTAIQDEPDLTRPSSIVCFGLGSVVQSRIAQLQLLLMLDLAARFEIKEMSAFDPAFTALDTPLLASYGVSVISENTHGRHPLPKDSKETCLIYMPHCPRGLYQNVLASNWSKEQLGRVVLLANEMEGYMTRDPLPKLQKIAPCVPVVAPLLVSRPVPISFAYNDVYNDLSFQWIPSKRIASVGAGENGWDVPLADEEGAGDEVL